jgi:transmembrane sensor
MNQAQPGEDDKLFEEALDLIIRLQNDPTNPVPQELIRRWRSRSPDHEAAWAEVAEIHGLAGKVFTDKRTAQRRKNRISRRKVVLGGGAAAIAAATAAVYGPDLILRSKADHVTSTAELRRITLSDGSIAMLGPDSAIAVSFNEQVRRVELLAGMVFFDVANEKSRPFWAVADDLTATALGTAFDVSKDAGFLSVSVDHGLVEIATPKSRLTNMQRLTPGEWLTLDEKATTVERGKRDVGQIAAWRDGMIVAERETVSAVVAKIARWHRGRIMIAGPNFGSRRISGVFDLHDPVAALEAVVHPHGGKVRQLSPWLTVVSPI